MRSALLDIPGVTRVEASLETGDVVITYDPCTTTVDSLVAVVNKTEAPVSNTWYNATVKVEPRPASTP